MYLGVEPFQDLSTNKIIFKSILEVRGSQCRDFKTGVICALFLVLVRTHAAAFCMSCNRLIFFFGRPAKRALLKSRVLLIIACISLSESDCEIKPRTLAVLLGGRDRKIEADSMSYIWSCWELTVTDLAPTLVQERNVKVSLKKN